MYNYNISQITDSKFNDNSHHMNADNSSDNFCNDHRVSFTKSQLNYKNDDESNQSAQMILEDQEILYDKHNEFDQFLNEHNLKYTNLPLKL